MVEEKIMNHVNLDKFYEGDTFTVNSNQSRDDFKKFIDHVYEDKKYITFNYVYGKPRSPKQRNAMELWFKRVAEILNNAGIYNRLEFSADKVMKIPWTNASVKTLWRCVQLNMYEVDSTKDLTSDKVTVIYDVLNELFVEHYSLHIPFPSVEMKGS